MKNRIYKIKDKILVQGDENLLKENEVLVKEFDKNVQLKTLQDGKIINLTNNKFYTNLSTTLNNSYEVPVEAVCTDYNSEDRTYNFEVDLNGLDVKVAGYDSFIITKFTTEDPVLAEKFASAQHRLILFSSDLNTSGISYTNLTLDGSSVGGALTDGEDVIENGVLLKIKGKGITLA